MCRPIEQLIPNEFDLLNLANEACDKPDIYDAIIYGTGWIELVAEIHKVEKGEIRRRHRAFLKEILWRYNLIRIPG